MEPWALLKAVRDSGGRVVDFVYHDINRVAAQQQRLRREDLLGRSVAESLPELVRSGILEKYVHCIDTGEPLVLDDLSYYGRTLDGPELQTHLYEMRGVRVETEYLSLNWRDVNRRSVANEQVVQTRELLRASADAMLDPQAILEAVRDSSGKIVDFAYREVNRALCDYLGLSREELFGRGVVETMPGIKGTLFPNYLRCLETGEPLVLDDFSYDNEILFDTRLYDLRVTRATSTSLVLTWRDVTDRFRNSQRIANSEALLRASADSMLDPQVLLEAVRDPVGRVVDFRYVSANQATLSYLQVTEQELIGRTTLDTLPNLEESGLLGRYAQCLADGEPVVLNDFSYFNHIIDDDRRYDIRATRAGPDLLTLSWTDVTDRFQAAQRALAAQTLLHATVDSMLNPQMLLEAVRDRTGQVVDFRYRSANRAFCSYRGWEEQDIIGQSLLEAQPSLRSLGLFERYIHCVATGESLVLDDFEMFNAMLGETRRFDIRVVRAGVDLISLTFSDVTERSQAAQRISASERSYRLLAENSSDMVTHVRDGRFAWISPSAAGVIGATQEYWVGRAVREIIPPEDAAAFAARLATLSAGGTIQERIRVVATDGVTHWADLHARPIYDDDGHQDGFTGALRLVDDEVAARRLAAEARTEKAKADERYRRSIDNAAVGMCLTTPEGHFEEVNTALCEFFGYDEATLKEMTWQELTAPEYLEADVVNVGKIMAGQMESYRLTKQFINAHGHRIWGELSVSCLRKSDGNVEWFIGQITDVTATVEATQQYKLLAENAGDLVVHVRDGRFAWISPSCTDVIGGSPDYWVGRDATEIVVPEEDELIADSTEAVESGGVVQLRHRVQALDGTIHWVHVHAKPFYAPDGREDGVTAAMRVIDNEVAAEQATEEARRQQAMADARYRLAMGNAAVGMCLSTPEGRPQEVNEALCRFFGYDAQTLIGMDWRNLTRPEDLKEEEDKHNAMLQGRTDSYRMAKQYIRADGKPIWGDLTVSALRGEDGHIQNIYALVTDITAQVQADERNHVLTQQLQEQTDRVKSELDSAAAYISSLMPSGLHGPVTVSSRYLPSRELGGDCLDYYWIDDDHLLIKLIDVSGHGLEPALLAVSVHNLMRSGSLTPETLLSPEAVLTELNRLFVMEQQSDHYFTMWYGIYEASTRTLRYASAGAPPALAFNAAPGTAIASTALSTPASPVGVFEDTEFTSRTYQVPPGCRLLIYSDGASEITLADGQQLTGAAFEDLANRVAASPDWSLDDLIDELRGLTPSGVFEDDFSLIQLTFD